mmetsp:Transcript_159207/g.305444  ORF Transcript_159207/g.305444 Transcript_159207/m.305444 type:complete len:995 (-) Transcript_159207:219-3203(-)
MTSLASVSPTKPATMQDLEGGFNSSHDRIHGLHQRLAKIENAGDPLLPKKESEIKSNEESHEANMEQKATQVTASAFQLNIKLAARTAFWVTFFGLPTFHIGLANWFFGSPAANAICGDELLGNWYKDPDQQIKSRVRAGKGDMQGKLVPWEVAVASGVEDAWDPDQFPEQVQCGILPDIYLGYWPTVMQMTIFSCFISCGNTVQLCWQGIMGTLLAVVNNVVLCMIFPKGINSTDNHAFFYVLAWTNFVVVTFVFLLSKAETNTIKFGLSTHVCLMMGFVSDAGPGVGVHSSGMGFNWDNESVCWFLTALLGALIAVLAMLLPRPLLNIKKVDDSTEAYCFRMCKNMHSALDYLCGEAVEPWGKQIAAKIQGGGDVLANVQNDVTAAWWECFDLGTPGKKRQLYKDFNDSVQTLQPLQFAVRRCVLEEDFEGAHRIFFQTGGDLHKAMDDLHFVNKALMTSISMKCEDGIINDDEKAELKKQVADVQAAQKKMVQVYLKSTLGLRIGHDADCPGTVRKDLGSEYSFMFCLSSWGKRQVTFANNFLVQNRGLKGKLTETVVKRFIVTPVKNTFNLEEMKKWEQVRYAIRNTISIVVTFWMGTRLEGTLFTKWSYLMPMTLSLLISRVPHGTFAKSYQRIEGVSLGKILPIMFLSLVNIFPCATSMNFLWHIAAIFLYMFGFQYMSFSSLQFGSVGCLGAAYGCAFFFVRCADEGSGTKEAEEANFVARYKEIGQIVGAVVVMIAVDSMFRGEPATETAVNTVKAIKEKVNNAYKAFFAGHVHLKESHEEIVKAIELAKAAAESVDPKLSIAPGYAPPFRYNFFTSLLPLFETFASDFNMLMLATGTDASRAAGERSAAHEDLVSQVVANKVPNVNITGIEEMRDHLFEEISLVMDAAIGLLEHPSGEPVEDDPNMDKITRSTDAEALQFRGTDEFVKDINSIQQLHTSESENSELADVTMINQVRLQVALQALSAAKKSLNSIADCVVANNSNI